MGLNIRLCEALLGPICAGMALGGFILFLHKAEAAKSQPLAAVDAIVVFSGEEQRVQRGVALLKWNWAKRLLLAGNDNGSEDIRQQYQHPALFGCCVDTVPNTGNTDDDAAVTARWIESRGYQSLIVVTSYSHMPRVLLELRQRLPRVRLIPSVIVLGNRDWRYWQHDLALWRVMLLEFFKCVRVQLWGLLGHAS